MNQNENKEIAVFINRHGNCVNVRWLSDENYNSVERITREEVTYESALAEFDSDDEIAEVYGHATLTELKAGQVFVRHNDGNNDVYTFDTIEDAPTFAELIEDHWNYDGERTIRLTIPEAKEQRENWSKLDEFLTT